MLGFNVKDFSGFKYRLTFDHFPRLKFKQLVLDKQNRIISGLNYFNGLWVYSISPSRSYFGSNKYSSKKLVREPSWEKIIS